MVVPVLQTNHFTEEFIMKLVKTFFVAAVAFFASVGMAGEKPSIIEIAKSNESFSTLVAAVEAAGLVETLGGEGQFTVFAPTNDAFAALPEGTVDALLKDKEALSNVLLYHVVADAEVPANVAVTLESATMANGQEISLSVREGELFLNEDVKVISTDIKASNGIIHVINAVLIP